MKKQKDTVDHVEESNLVQMSRELLEALVTSTAILTKRKMTEQGLKEGKLVLGYLNASLNATKARMQWFKMTGLEGKLKSVKDSNGR